MVGNMVLNREAREGAACRANSTTCHQQIEKPPHQSRQTVYIYIRAYTYTQVASIFESTQKDIYKVHIHKIMFLT